MSKNAPENGAFYGISILTFWAGCDSMIVSKRKHATLTIRNTKKMSGRPSFKEMSNVAQCIESEVKCRTTKEPKHKPLITEWLFLWGLDGAKRTNQQSKPHRMSQSARND